MDVEKAVGERYSAAAAGRQTELCCPISYNPKYLEAIPAEVIERDYGCGDPSAHVRVGETVLDLGSGGGKACFIAAQVVGETGRVIGIDMNPEMLALARSAAPEVARRIGYENVEFVEGKIQDLAAIADESIDVVISNCVLNLVREEEKERLFAEMFRVTRVGGRVVVSDIVGDEEVPPRLREDPELWSGCVSGALREDRFLQALVDAGFYGVRLHARDKEPWRTVDGIEFRSVTVEAFKGKEGACLEGLHAVIYKGPFSHVADDDGHRIPRGVRYAVCDKTFRLFSRPPYAEHFEFVEPLDPPKEMLPFDCARDAIRHPRESKGMDYDVTSACTGPDCC